MWVKRLSSTLAALSLTYVSTSGCGISQRIDVPEDGPLYVGTGSAVWALEPKLGYRFADGSSDLVVRGESPIRIVSVESLGGGPSLRYLGAKVVYPGRAIQDTLRFEGWPPHGRGLGHYRVVDAVGQIVTPDRRNWHHQPFELLLGYEVVSTREAVRTGVRIVYTSGGKLYQATFPMGIAVCPSDRNQNRCSDRALDLVNSLGG